jgi:hypothetical protein
MGRLFALVVVLLALAAVGPAAALAQEGTPAAGLGEAIDPEECQIEPRSADELIALWYPEDEAGTPVQSVPEPAADLFPTSVPAPIGAPADAETVAEVTAAVRETIACWNAGDILRATAFFSDEIARYVGPPPGTPIEDARAFLNAPPEPRPVDERWRLIAVTDVSVMEDGRIGALYVSDDPQEPPEGAETEFVVVVEEGGRWVADAIAEFTVVQAGDEGTPVS